MTRQFCAQIIHFFLIVGIITISISPACKFVSGDMSLMEICTPFGIQKIALSQDGTNAPVPTERGTTLSEKCAFCFSTQTQKIASADVPHALINFSHSKTYRLFKDAQRPTLILTGSLGARAPPIFS